MTRDERYLAKIDYGDDCWEWTAFRNPCGYGTFCGGDEQLAHRYGYRLFIGPIPDGLQVLHHCDNPPCQRPEHLFLGTPAINSADKISKGRHRSRGQPGTENHSARFSETDVASIRDRYLAGETQSALAAGYGTVQGNISRIVTGKAWRHIGPVIVVDGGARKLRGIAHPHAKLDDDQVRALRVLHAADGLSYAELGRRFGISATHASDIARGRARPSR